VRPPLLWIAIAFGAGLWTGLEAFGAHPGSGVWAIGIPLLAGTALVVRRAPMAGAVGLAGVAGLLWGTSALARSEASCGGRWAQSAASPSATTHAAIVRLVDPVGDEGGVVGGGVQPGVCGGNLSLRWPAGHAASGGTTWVVAGRWMGDARRGVLRVRTVRLLDTERRGRGGLRDRIARRSLELFGTRSSLVDALVIGRRGNVDPTVRERFARAGLAHLLSISGLHVGFLAAWLALVLRWLGIPPRARLVAAVGIVFGYCWLLGFPAPATRAALMLAVGGAGRLRQRVVAPRGTVGLAALIMMIGDPWTVRNTGAWLSLAAITAVIWAGRAVKGPPWARLLAPAAAATLLTAPITAFAFGTVAPIGVLANIIAIPLGGVAVPGILFALLCSAFWPAVGALLAAGAGLALALLDTAARIAAAVPGGHIITTPGWTACAVWMGMVGLAWWLWIAPRRPWLLAARAAFVLALLSWGSLFWRPPRDRDGVLTVHFLDVGQGDATALHTPGGHWVVIDGGPRTPAGDAGRRIVLPFLRRHGAGRLSMIVASHGDADHLGGLPAVIETLSPEIVLEPGEPLGRPLYLQFLADIELAGAAWYPGRAGDKVELDGVRFEVLSPDSAWLATPAEVNDHGVVLLVSYGDTRLLFQGDAGVAVESRLLGRIGHVDLLKVGHHGSRTATSEAWLDELTPGEAVISVGTHNTYGHPAPAVLARLLQHQVTTLRTDRLGTITFTSDGHHAQRDFRRHD
jgi:competence protein ComEC